jgi:hypothetical protein
MPSTTVPGPAPIALFAYNRPEHLERALRSLDANSRFPESPLHLFLDAAREAGEIETVARTRAVAHEWPHPHKSLHEAAVNLGVARSVGDGVTMLCERYGRVIVVEDDLVVAPAFLDFMNRALDAYVDDERVMQISGHMFPVEPASGKSSATFLPFVTSWGWATWARAWAHFDSAGLCSDAVVGTPDARRRFDLDGAYPYFRMLRRQQRGEIDSWAICWYLSVFGRAGLVLYPARSLVRNEGFDGSGMHCERLGDTDPSVMAWEADCPPDLPKVRIDEEVFSAVKEHLRGQRSLVRRVARMLRRRLTGANAA